MNENEAVVGSPLSVVSGSLSVVEQTDDAARSSLPQEMEDGKWKTENQHDADDAAGQNKLDDGTPAGDAGSSLPNEEEDDAARSSLPSDMEDGKWKMEKEHDAVGARVLPKRRWGAVQRLSPRVRLFVNNAMREGLTYKQILSELAKRRVTCLSVKQLRDWKRTGYAEWLADQVYFEKLVLHLDGVRPVKTPTAGRKNFRELSQLDIAAQLHAAARKFNLEKFCEHLNAKPESFFRLVFANALHERNAILRDRMELDSTRYRDVSRKEKRARKPKRGGVTLEELERIDERMRL